MDADELATLRQHLLNYMTRQRGSIDDAVASLASVGVNADSLEKAAAAIRADQAENSLLNSPFGVADRSMAENAKLGPWYSGPEPDDQYWPPLKSRLLSGRMAEVVPEIDRASTKVVAQLANPRIWDLKKLGLVLGYVQSGKTANYTAVMAKAADSGYGLFIVLSGIHNNLRQQTQVRISKDLGLASGRWVSLTTEDADFANDPRHSGASQLRPDRPVVIVAKKHPKRLEGLRAWLEQTPLDVRKRIPVLLLDDEADQATPNSATARQRRTAINRLIREIWALIPTGTYVGYTATPFANIFIDPNDDDDLYPRNFIIDLPRPDNYFGAERLFGREPLDGDDDPDTGLDVIRTVTDSDAAILRPPSAADARSKFDHALPDSLKQAVEWFLVASAIRLARGQRDHSSMLVHTTHYAGPHFTMQGHLQDHVEDLKRRFENGDIEALHLSYVQENDRVSEIATVAMPAWTDVAARLREVFAAVRVIVDNGMSEDRLDYGRQTAAGEPIWEVVIAVGGGTLSRGLTLEGLVVSYFTRTSNTYDTLLQMGRWFGYRPGYEDLPRLWVQGSLEEDYRFLALVEAEMRADIADMERQLLTPAELGVRVRQHPGRLSIVARNKMGAAGTVRISYAGERLQTFMFDRNPEIAARNLDAVLDFLKTCRSASTLEVSTKPARWRYRDIAATSVRDLIETYAFHPDQVTMRAEYMAGWISEVAPDSLWNVTVVGNSKPGQAHDGQVVDLGSLDLGDGAVNAVNRAPLQASAPGVANIKALLGQSDWFEDLDRQEVKKKLGDLANDQAAMAKGSVPRAVRRTLAKGRGQILIYIVSKDSVAQTAGSERVRETMNTERHLIGLGIIFPELPDEQPVDATYYAVTPDWPPEIDPSEDDEPEDREGDAELQVGTELREGAG